MSTMLATVVGPDRRAAIQLPADDTVKAYLDGVYVPVRDWRIVAHHHGWRNFTPDLAESAFFTREEDALCLLGRRVTVQFHDDQTVAAGRVVSEQPFDTRGVGPVLCRLEWESAGETLRKPDP